MNYLFAIKADKNTCKPYTGPGWVGHVVLVTDRKNPTVIDEFTTTPGALSHVACAPSALQSWLLDETTVRTTIGEIETLAGTSYPTGTSFLGIERAVAHFGELSALSASAQPGNIMNPGGGYVDPITTFSAYLAARQGGNDCLALGVVAPKPTPPPPGPLEDVEVFLATAGVRAAGEGADPHGNGAVYLCDGIFKSHIPGSVASTLPQYEAMYGAVRDFSKAPWVLDRMIEIVDQGPAYHNLAASMIVSRPTPTPDPDPN